MASAGAAQPMWRWVSLAALVVLLLAAGPLQHAIRDVVDGLRPDTSDDTVWNDAWPDTWRDHSVLIVTWPPSAEPALPRGWFHANGSAVDADPVEREDEAMVIGGLGGGTTVLEHLLSGAGALDVEVEHHREALGAFVDSIGGLDGGTDGQWWQIWVDGRYIDDAVDREPVANGSVVEWRFA